MLQAGVYALLQSDGLSGPDGEHLCLTAPQPHSTLRARGPPWLYVHTCALSKGASTWMKMINVQALGSSEWSSVRKNRYAIDACHVCDPIVCLCVITVCETEAAGTWVRVVVQEMS